MNKVLKKHIDKNRGNCVFYIGELHQDILANFYPNIYKRRNNGCKQQSN
jgi:hypothetical protein